MLKLLEKLTNKLFLKKTYNDFDKSNPLGGGGERVDIIFGQDIDYNTFDIYQQSHYKRYEYALEVIKSGDVCGDFACGTGYGSVMLSQKAKKVIGADINNTVISEVNKRYKHINNVEFFTANLLSIKYDQLFDAIVSFETIEHFAEEDIEKIFSIFDLALKPGGKLIFSTPYMQEKTEAAIKMGFHLTFHINGKKIEEWLSQTGFRVISYKYQNYQSHILQDELIEKDFIVCVAQKN